LLHGKQSFVASVDISCKDLVAAEEDYLFEREMVNSNEEIVCAMTLRVNCVQAKTFGRPTPEEVPGDNNNNNNGAKSQRGSLGGGGGNSARGGDNRNNNNNNPKTPHSARSGPTKRSSYSNNNNNNNNH